MCIIIVYTIKTNPRRIETRVTDDKQEEKKNE